MKIYINRQETETQASDIRGLASELALPERGVALAVSNRIVPRAEWERTPLAENDQITIIKAAFGG